MYLIIEITDDIEDVSAMIEDVSGATAVVDVKGFALSGEIKQASVGWPT